MKKIVVLLLTFLLCAPNIYAADKKISQLDAAVSVSSSDVVPIVSASDGKNYKATVSQLTGTLGTLATDNSTASHMIYKDSDGHVENLTVNGLTFSNGVLSPGAEVDGHAHITLTAAQVSGTTIYNTGQGAEDVVNHLPTAAANMSFLLTVGTAQAGNHFGVQADTNDKIYLIAADGTIAAGDNNAAVVFTAAQVGQQAACWTFKTDAYDWACKQIAIGTSTFAAHATGF